MPSKVSPEQGLEKDSNILAAISYLSLLIAVIIYLIRKEDKFVRFHAMQSIIFDIAYSLIFIVLWFLAVAAIFTFVLALVVFPLIFLFTFAMLIVKFYLAYKAFLGERYSAPVIGEYAEKYSS